MDKGVGGLDRVAANERRFLERAKSRSAESPIVLECECTSASCDKRIELTAVEYEPVRSSAACYAICPDEMHVNRRSDRIVERQPLYWVVERRPSLKVLEFYSSSARTLPLS